MWQIHYHIVFPVKYRKALLDTEVVKIIVETSKGITERYAIEIERMGMDRDHIHLLCGAHPKVSIGEIVRIFKSITAREEYSPASSDQTRIVGRRILDRWVLRATVGEGGDWHVV